MNISPDLIFGSIAFLLTIFVFSYLIGDQILFRIAIYIFVGTSAGYVASVAWHQVLVPHLVNPVFYGSGAEQMMALFPMLLVILLLFKAIPSVSHIGTPSLAFMVGAGTAVAIGGAVQGTIIPQVMAAINTFDLVAALQRGDSSTLQLFEAILMLVGTVSTLIYFQFSARRADDGTYKRNPVIRIIALIGGGFIAVTLGVLFAGVYSAALTALIERLSFLINFLRSLLSWLL
jgi:hypothetical protein